jgi:hypothetical protein
LHKCQTDDGTIIFVNPEDENADSSLRCKFDPDSHEIDESEPRYEKYDLLRCETDDRMTIVLNPEKEMQILQFFAGSNLLQMKLMKVNRSQQSMPYRFME